MSIVFGYEAYRKMVADFATRTPEVLGRHASTADLALDVDRLNILSSMDCRFTVAVVGQMRVGKSTLLNSIIGKDLAPTGVTETTATINWFRHGSGDLCEKFRVHWNDGSTDDFDLGTVGEWLGDGAKAKRTQHLDFFADTTFLNTANIVDTPGTRSVIDSHEGATRGFIMDDSSEADAAAQRLDDATRQQGGRADAVIYVLNPVARKKDADFLDMFGDNTRLPGASVHNSIAVIQKWEHLGDDPVAEAHRKCERIREQLEGKVAAVIPTSGLLANYANKLPLRVWDQVATLACESGEDDYEDLRDSPDFFVDELEECPLSIDQRQELLDTILWPALRFSIHLARSQNLRTGEGLRAEVYKASGLEQLRTLLEKRFFAHAELIKANTVLRKAWGPCMIGLGRLRNLEQERGSERREGMSILRVLQAAGLTSADRAQVEAYIQTSMKTADADLGTIRALRKTLDELRCMAFENFEALEKDLQSIKSIDSEDGRALSGDEKRKLALLFGLEGAEIWRRLGVESPTEESEVLIETAEDAIDFWDARYSRGVPHRRLVEHARQRLDQILDALEEAV